MLKIYTYKKSPSGPKSPTSYWLRETSWEHANTTERKLSWTFMGFVMKRKRTGYRRHMLNSKNILGKYGEKKSRKIRNIRYKKYLELDWPVT